MGLAVNVAAVTNLYDQHKKAVVLDGVNGAVVANSEAIVSLFTGQEDYTGRSWIVAQRFKTCKDPASNRLWQSFEIPLRLRRKINCVSHGESET